jgi:hypothetical protein
MSGIRNKSILLCVLALLVASGLAASAASAARAPTPQEKHEIVVVSQRIQRAPGSESEVGVGHLRVTDNGRWALATVTPHYASGPPDSAQAIYRLVRGHWTITAHSPGTGYGMQCGIAMPASAMRELGLGTNCTEAAQRALAITASCSRVVKYDGGAFQGGFYRYRDMSCHEAHSIVREYFEHGRAPRGFRCSEVSPRPTRPEGATLCTSGKPLVEFAGE